MSKGMNQAGMIAAIGTLEQSGGLRTLTESYQASFAEMGLDIHWFLFAPKSGANQYSAEVPNQTILFLDDSWSYYSNPQLCDPKIKKLVREKLQSLQAPVLFRPLQFTYEPYLSDLGLPQLKMIHLVTKELYESARRQSYKEDPRVQMSLKADLIRCKYEEEFLNSASQLILNSQTTKSDLFKHYPHTKYYDLTVSAPGAREEFFKISDFEVSRSAFFFGRWNHQKGIPHLLHPVPQAWRFDCWGQGKWPKEELSKHGIHLKEWQSSKDVRKKLSEVTFCIFPSHYEPWGLSLNEALASGRICIAQSGAGGHEEQIRHGENGFLIDFSQGSFWDQLEEIFSLGKNELLKVSDMAKSQARRWNDHVETLYQQLSRFRK